jgi:hypothetical protein
MDKATTAAILGTIIGLAAGVFGMVFFGPDRGDDQALARVSTLQSELDRAADELANAQRALDEERRGREAECRAAADIARQHDESSAARADEREELVALRDELHALKTGRAEDKRQADARIRELYAVLEKHGIVDHLSEAEIRQRIESAEQSFRGAFDTLNKKDAMQALWDMQKLGPLAYDTAIELWRLMAADFGIGENWGRGPGKLGMNRQEFVSLISSFALIERGLTDPDVALDFRINAIYGAPWWSSEDPEKRAALVGNLLLGASGFEARAAVESLRDMNAPSTVRYLSDFLAQNTNDPAARTMAVRVLAAKNTDEGWAAVEKAAQSDSDPGVRQAAQESLGQRNPTAEGLLITFVGPDSQAALAGIKVGDILTHYNGVKVRTVQEVIAARDQAPAGQAVPVVVRRGSSDVTLTLGPGQIGINGVPVTPKE